MRLREFIFHNLGRKLLSIVLACLIWFTINPRVEKNSRPLVSPVFSRPELTFRLPVWKLTSRTSADGFSIQPSQVEVTVTGDAGVLEGLSHRDFAVYVNLVGLRDTQGAHKRVLVSKPEKVQVARVVPEDVWVERSTADPSRAN